ncbi:hypothetical protein TrST_g4028 [Triparma strigata]|uniref:phosphatidylinositol 3-kinase n=1 Tax=Triparma strigata TaxID=1606541 RepID=A0A9W7BPG3_9STRA|nr:hypothetical protein TrST_g4028 [Triparma strigata]
MPDAIQQDSVLAHYDEQTKILDILRNETKDIATLTPEHMQQPLVKYLSSSNGKSLLKRVHDASNLELRTEFDSLLQELAEKQTQVEEMKVKLNKQRGEVNLQLVNYNTDLVTKLTKGEVDARANIYKENATNLSFRNEGHWKKAMKHAKNLSKKNKIKTEDTTAEFHARKLWSHMSGNTHEPDELKRFSVEDEEDAEGVTWTLKHKPEQWIEIEQDTDHSDSDDEGIHRMSTSQLDFTSSRQKRCSTNAMPITDFLISIPTFQHLDRDAIALLEDSCTMQIFSNGKEILAEDETSEFVYVIREGIVGVIKRRDYRDCTKEKVMSLTQGDYFGEGSFTGKHKGSSAAYVADGDVLSISIPMSTYESIFTTSSNLIGDGVALTIDASNNTEVLSLTRHIDQFNELLQMVFVRTKREVLLDPVTVDDSSSAKEAARESRGSIGGTGRFSSQRRSTGGSKAEQKAKARPSLFRSVSGVTEGSPVIEESPKTRKKRGSVIATVQQNDASDVSNEALMLDLLTAFTPELSLEDVLERIIKVTREVFCVQRASVFIVDDEAEELILKVSRDVKGVRVPMKGMCGHVAKTGDLLNISDAYDDNRFDPAMDKKSSFRTKQVLCVPVKAGNDQAIVGVMQCINTVDDLPFTQQDEDLLTMVSMQLGQVLAKQSVATAFTDDSKFIPIQDVTQNFRINIKSATTAKTFSAVGKEHRHIACKAQLYHGGVKLGKEMVVSNTQTTKTTHPNDKNMNLLKATFGAEAYGGDFNVFESNGAWISNADVKFKNLPHGTRIIFQLFSKNGHPCGWTGCNLFQFDHRMRSGVAKLQLWPGECPTSNATAMERKTADAHLTILEIEFFSLNGPRNDEDEAHEAIDEKPIIYRPLQDGDQVHTLRAHGHKNLQYFLKRLPSNDAQRVEKLIYDPTAIPRKEDFELIWDLRLTLTQVPEALHTLLLTVDWLDPKQVAEVYRLLYAWETLEPMLALQLLDHRFPDPRVRAYAVQCLGVLSDEELRKYLLQLTQTLKFEPFHDSALSRFLLRRALSNPTLIGHIFFWLLKAEMHVDVVRERFGCILDLYLRNCGTHRLALGHQLLVMKRLESVAAKVKEKETKAERLVELREQLKRCDFPIKFQLPLNPDMRARSIKIDKCRVMESKKKPLWLVFEDADNEQNEITVMFKAGDDLRQDQLTLQVLGIMNSLWKGEGYDLCMSPYNCVTTGDELGMLEVVTNSMTLAGIIGDNQASTGTSRRKLGAVMDALGNDKIFRNWLEENNSNGKLGGKEVEENSKPTHTEGEEEKEAQLQTAVSPEGEELVGFALAKEKFLQSCAGYTVATFVLGIGDRHNDNIMLKRTGEIFHIDFGHFLGNFKKKLGFKREKAPFVFTPAFAAVLDGFKSPTFHRFEDLCCECLLILRKHAGLLITLFSLMISCGIPELTHEDDINYLKERLMLDLNEDQVKKEFKKIITTSMKTKTTRVNDAIHVYVHT